MRDYERWHDAYDDPDSPLSWRLGIVRGYLRDALDEARGPLRVLSACAGDGRDVLGALAGRPDAVDVAVTLIELNAALADRARVLAADAGLAVDVRTADAGTTDAYAGAAPADVVLLVGILGNVELADIERTVRAAPQLCTPGAVLVWSRGVPDGETHDVNGTIRGWFADAGFVELDYRVGPPDDSGSPAVGALRFEGEPRPLRLGEPLFTFVR